MIVSSASPEPRTVSAYSRCSGLSSVSSSSPVMPITPFIGVRISWLMLARNSDFRRERLERLVAGDGQVLLDSLALADVVDEGVEPVAGPQ